MRAGTVRIMMWLAGTALTGALAACEPGEKDGDTGSGASGGEPSSGSGTGNGGAGGAGAAAGAGGASGSGAAASSGASTAGSGGGPAPDCSAADCGTCGKIDGCGWCGATGTCMPGEEPGPTTATCDNGWAPTGDLFECFGSECAAFTDCETCSADVGCGFCASSGKCIAGATEGPAPQWGSCEVENWQYSACPSQCASVGECTSCDDLDINNQIDAGCGWCQSTHTCMPGNLTGPTAGSCPDWRPEWQQCFL